MKDVPATLNYYPGIAADALLFGEVRIGIWLGSLQTTVHTPFKSASEGRVQSVGAAKGTHKGYTQSVQDVFVDSWIGGSLYRYANGPRIPELPDDFDSQG